MNVSSQDLPRIAVIGGGLAGLTTVYELVRLTRTEALPLEIRLYEAEGRLGGLVETTRHEDFLLERGPDSIFTRKPAGLQLVIELDLLDELIPAHTERGVRIWWGDALHPMPPGLTSLGSGGLRPLFGNSLLGFGGKLRASMERLVPRRRSRADESIASFVKRRFGRQMLERVGDPLLAGIHAGDPTMLSIRHTFPRLPEMEQEHGSVARGRKQAARDGDGATSFPGVPDKLTRAPFVSFRSGMQTLVDGLVGAIRERDIDALHTGKALRELRPAGDPAGSAAYSLEFDDGDTWVADVCVLAVPARPAAELVEPFEPDLAVELGAVPHASSLGVYLAYGPGDAADVPEATGCLVPHSQGHPVFACSFVHRKFDFRVPPGGALLRAFMGGMRKPELVRGDDRTLVRIAREEMAALLGIQATPLFSVVQRWPRAHPQYVVGHADRVAAVDRHLEAHAGLLIAGSALHGVGIPDVIESGRRTAATVADLVRARLSQ